MLFRSLGALVAGQLAFVFALCIFAGWFPVQMARNLIRLLVGWLVILAVDWTGHQLANTNPGWANFANVVTSLSLLATASYWTVTLNAEGATQIVGQALRWDADRMDRMTTQLNRMGAQLSRRGY